MKLGYCAKTEDEASTKLTTQLSHSHVSSIHQSIKLTGSKCANVEFEEWTDTHTHKEAHRNRERERGWGGGEKRERTAAHKTTVKLIMYTLAHTSRICWSTWRFRFQKSKGALSVRTLKFPHFFSHLLFSPTKIEVLCSREGKKKKKSLIRLKQVCVCISRPRTSFHLQYLHWHTIHTRTLCIMASAVRVCPCSTCELITF